MADERQTKHDGREPDRVRAVLGRYIRREDLAWPSAPRDAPAAGELREYFRGCLLWGAVGDALGRPAEGHRPEALRKRFGPHGLQEFVPWYGWRGGPKGTFTDDTQLTMAVAESLLAVGGTLSPDDLARRFVTMRSRVRGIGHATKVALGAMERGTPWWEAGDIEQSAGNGAAMRAAPVGLLHALNPSTRPLVRDAVLSAVPTHTHPVGVAGAVAVSAGVAWCARARAAGASALDVDGFVDFVCGAIAGIESEPTQERKPGGEAVRLVDRLRELPNLLTWPDPEEVFAYTYNGAFALESVPAALYCFLRSPDDPRHVLLTAVNAGYDADTVASMAGNLAGAWNGAKALERVAPSWWADLEDRDGLSALADRLADLALAPRKPSGPQGAETMPAHRTSRRTPEHFAGCLLGGAVGDALGAAVEFKSLREIRRRFGPDGIRDYAPAYGRLGAITDDTQMTLFTAEGLIRAANRFRDRGICHPPMVVYHAYQRWLDTHAG